jgi:hypothetical protein
MPQNVLFEIIPERNVAFTGDGLSFRRRKVLLRIIIQSGRKLAVSGRYSVAAFQHLNLCLMVFKTASVDCVTCYSEPSLSQSKTLEGSPISVARAQCTGCWT